MRSIAAFFFAVTVMQGVAFAAGDLEAFIYVKSDDNAFKRAAEHQASLLDSGPTRLSIEATSKADFVSAWNQVAEKAETDDLKVKAVYLFVHSSIQSDGNDGLEFEDSTGAPETIKREDIRALKKLPWKSPDETSLFLFGCNTSSFDWLLVNRKWCPAEYFAQVQSVETLGETGYAYFSKDLDTYVEQSPSDTEIFLRAYRRKRNAILGDGSRMPPTIFSPYLSGSVGEGGQNTNRNVLIVQQILNMIPSTSGGPTSPVDEDGLIGPATINAIKHFQSTQLGFEDGLVEPGKLTLLTALEFIDR